jgi:hypothetical protein
MSEALDPIMYKRCEEQFLSRIGQLLSDERLRLETTEGKKSVTLFIREVAHRDRGVQLKRLMAEMNRPDRKLEARMPLGKSIDMQLSQTRWLRGKTPVGRLQVICLSSIADLIAGKKPGRVSTEDVQNALAEVPPPLADVPTTLVLMSTSGFTDEALQSMERDGKRTVVFAWPNGAGGWSASGAPNTEVLRDLLDPERSDQKRARVKAAIEARRAEWAGGGVAADKLSAQTLLPLQFVETELKSYAREKPGLATRRLDGRLVMFSQSASVAPAAPAARLPSPLRGVIDMPFIERLRALFSRKGDVEKKIALLSERRAALTQQRDRGYDEMGILESRESTLRKEFADSTSDLSRKRVTSQLVQLRKDIARRQELLTVLNQQINVISTHLHTLELQRQGKAANLPDGEELAADAAKAEQVLAELEANSEFADGVGTSSAGSLSSEEQALYDELMAAKPASEPAVAEKPAVKSEPVKPPPLPASPAQQKQRPQAEPG